jgi:hypothetical protein
VRNILVFVGIVSLAACSQCRPGPGQGPGDDADRPPIIVSDGSVHLRTIAKNQGTGTNNRRGTWEKDPNNSNQWFHDHGNEKARRLLVNVLYGSGGANCSSSTYVHSVRSVTVTYSDGVADQAFMIYIDARAEQAPGNVLTSLTEATAMRDTKLSEWLEVINASHLVSVTLGAETCTLERGKGQIHIYQRIQP